MHENGVGMGRNVMGWDCAGNGNRWSGDRVCLGRTSVLMHAIKKCGIGRLM